MLTTAGAAVVSESTWAVTGVGTPPPRSDARLTVSATGLYYQTTSGLARVDVTDGGWREWVEGNVGVVVPVGGGVWVFSRTGELWRLVE